MVKSFPHILALSKTLGDVLIDFEDFPERVFIICRKTWIRKGLGNYLKGSKK